MWDKEKMKNLILILIGFNIVLGNQISSFYNFDIAATVKQDGKACFRGDYDCGTMQGAPSLPVISKTFLLPENTDLKTIQVALINFEISDLSESFIVDPNPMPIDNGLLIAPQGYTEKDGKLIEIYESNNFYPADPVYNVTVGKMRSFNLVTVFLSPFQYNPVTKKIKKISRGELQISFNEKRTFAGNIAVPSLFTKKLQDITENYDEAISGYSINKNRGTRAKGHYVIITTESIKNSLSNLNAFMNIKRSLGYEVSLFTEAVWGGSQSSGASHIIRDWLKENYESKGFTHLLIIDHPATGQIPMQVACPDFGGRYLPYVDYYYSDLSGDWDKDGDGKYAMFGFSGGKDMGEGGADQYAELFVGRIPYYGNSSVVDAILDKINKYNKESETEISWRENAFFPMSDFGPGYGDGQKYGSVVESNVITPAGWDLTSKYSTSCNMDYVLSTWNSNKFGLVVWQGHGLYNYAEGVMNNSYASRLEDDYPPHVFQTSCHNGKPENPENIAFKVLKYGAVSTIAAAVQVLYTANKTTYGVKGGARDFGYIYSKNLVLEGLPSGEAHAKARSDLKMQFSTDWLNCVENSLYGCPATGVYTAGGDEMTGIATSFSVISPFSLKVINDGHSIEFIPSMSLHLGGKISVYSINGKLLVERKVNSNEQRITFGSQKQIQSLFGSGLYIIKVALKDLSGKICSVTEKVALRNQ